MKHQCILCTCVDPRENRAGEQHRALNLYEFYTPRRPGVLIHCSEDGELSQTTSLVGKMDRIPTIFLQGHQDCAAIREFMESYEKPREEMEPLHRTWHKTHGDVLHEVMVRAAHLDDTQKHQVLAMACVIKSANNLYNFLELKKLDIQPIFFLTYSLSPPAPIDAFHYPHDIPLMVFDPHAACFMHAYEGNNAGCRMRDLVDSDYEAVSDLCIRAPIALTRAIENLIICEATHTYPKLLNRKTA